jgi:hypothetical protein
MTIKPVQLPNKKSLLSRRIQSAKHRPVNKFTQPETVSTEEDEYEYVTLFSASL